MNQYDDFEYNPPPEPPESIWEVVVSFLFALILVGLVFVKGCGR